MLLLIIILFLLVSYFSVLFWGPFGVLCMPLPIVILFFCFMLGFLSFRIPFVLVLIIDFSMLF